MSNVIDTSYAYLPTDMCEQLAGSGLTVSRNITNTVLKNLVKNLVLFLHCLLYIFLHV